MWKVTKVSSNSAETWPGFKSEYEALNFVEDSLGSQYHWEYFDSTYTLKFTNHYWRVEPA